MLDPKELQYYLSTDMYHQNDGIHESDVWCTQLLFLMLTVDQRPLKRQA